MGMDWAAGFWKRAEEVSLQASPSRDRVIDLLLDCIPGGACICELLLEIDDCWIILLC